MTTARRDRSATRRPATAAGRREGPATDGGEPRLIVVPTADDVADSAANIVCDALSRAIDERGEAHIALTGGSSAAPLYERLAGPPWRDRVDWTRVHLWWGDERYVPSEHPESNARLAQQMLLGLAARATMSGEGASGSDILAGRVPGVAVPAGQIHPFPVSEAIGRGPASEQWAASQYAETIRSLVPADANGIPTFDVVLLGVGPDGHLLSVFPGSTALRDDAPLVVAVPAPEHVAPHVARLTLNPGVVGAAGLVVVMATGGGKAEIVGRVLGGELDVERLPAQLARRDGAVWIVDEAAAANVPDSLAGSADPPMSAAG